MKKTIILFIYIVVYQVTTAQIVNTNEFVPRTSTLPGISNPAFPYAQTKDTVLTKKALEELGDELASWVASGELVGGELLIIQDEKTIFHEAYGWSDLEKKRPVKRNSIWSIKSMSKPFTASAIMMLSEQGKLSVNDKLIDYIPEYAGDSSTTLAHLLSHSSGYDELRYTQGHEDLGSWVNHMATLSPTEELGTYQYSDFNYAALGYIVELVGEMPLEEYLQINFLNPLELNESYTNFSPDSSWASDVNSRYRLLENRYVKYWSNTDPQGWKFYPSAWGIWGTAMDYSKFMSMFLNQGSFNDRHVLNVSTVKEMLTPITFSGETPIYGLGWCVQPYEANSSTPRFMHGGVDGTWAIAYPEDNLIVIFMTHCRDSNVRSEFINRLGRLGLASYTG